jgi:hypothetical protein
LSSILRPSPGGNKTPSGANTRSTRLPSEKALHVNGETDIAAIFRGNALHHGAGLVLGTGRGRFADDLPIAMLGLDGAAFGRRRRLCAYRGTQQDGGLSQENDQERAAP